MFQLAMFNIVKESKRPSFTDNLRYDLTLLRVYEYIMRVPLPIL